jgi:hypothetical protein
MAFKQPFSARAREHEHFVFPLLSLARHSCLFFWVKPLLSSRIMWALIPPKPKALTAAAARLPLAIVGLEPRAGLGIDVARVLGPVDLAVGRRYVQGWRQNLVVQSQGGF